MYSSIKDSENQTILRKKKNPGGIVLPDFKVHTTKLQSLKSYGTRTKTGTHQWNRIESPEMNQHLYINLWQEGNNIQLGKNSLFNNSTEKPGQLHAKESNWTTFSHYIQKLIQIQTLKFTFKGLNVKPEIIKTLQENRACMLWHWS